MNTLKDNSCVVWAQPGKVNGVMNTGPQALKDIYDGCMKSAYELLGDNILVDNNTGVPEGKVAVMTVNHLQEVYAELAAHFGSDNAQDIMELLLGAAAKHVIN